MRVPPPHRFNADFGAYVLDADMLDVDAFLETLEQAGLLDSTDTDLLSEYQSTFQPASDA